MSAFELQQGYQEGISAVADNTQNSNHTTTKTRTILRIKRRRTETPIPCIRLEGLTTKTVPESIGGGREREEKEGFGGDNEPAEGGRNNYNSTLLHEEKDNCNNKNINNGSKRRRGSAVLWKRFDPNNNEDDDERRNEQGEKYRIVDAILAEESDDDGDNELKRSIGEGDENNGYNGTAADDHHLHHHKRSKRRKLTLLDSSMLTSNTPIADTVEQLKMSNYSPSLSSPSKSNKSTRAASAAAAAAALKKKKGALKVLDPLTRIVDDSLKEVLIGEKTIESHYRQLTTDPTFTLRDISSQRKWMTWNLNNNAGGDGGNILHCCALWNDSSIANELLQRYIDLGSTLMEAVDGDGRTPYEVAQLIGHERVCEILEIYGGDTTNYVYDVFYLDDASTKTEDPMMTTNADAEKDLGKINADKDQVVDDDYDEDGPTGIMTAELTSGVGYWTPEGELILEADLKHARSFSEETDGDIDSNCEEYGGNDYPEEYDEEQDGDDADVYREYKQMRTMLQQQQGQQPRVHNYDNENYDFSDDDDNHDEYDWEEDL
jgi:hypothetical protein